METVAELVSQGLLAKLPQWDFQAFPVEDLPVEGMEFCLRCVSDNLGGIYKALKGPRWKSGKAKEMKEDGLWYFISQGRGFVSMKIVEGYLYIYEIQLLESHRGVGGGTKIMEAVHEAVVNSGRDIKLLGSALTVFSSNSLAKKFYFAMGYKIAEGSPQDLKLRGGKIIEPDYYILERARG